MNIARPWDCEAFPKSKTICYGGGGGGGGGSVIPMEMDPDIKKAIDHNVNQLMNPVTETVETITDTVSEVTPDIKIPTALDQTSFDNSIVDDATNVISDTVDDLTPDSFQDLSNQVSDNTPDLKNTITSTQDLSNAISDSTPTIKNTTTSTQDLVEQIPTVPEILTKVDETGDAAATFVKGGVQAATDAGTAIAEPFVDAYTGSDLDTVLQQAEDRAKLVLGYKGGTTSPDPTGAVQNTINTNPLQDITDAFGNIVESLVNVPVRTSAQPTVAAGDVPGGPIASPEEPIVGITQRNRQMMSGRRKTMLTVGQSAAKIRARQTGY